MINHRYLWKVAPREEDQDMDDESIRDDLFRPSADARIFMRITINMRRKCAIENTGREVLESELESNNYHSKKMRNGKDRKRSAGIKLALEVKGAVCCANPWAKARVLEKKLYQSGKCLPIKQFASQSWLCLQEEYLHYMALILQISAYILKTVEELHTNFGDSETYAPDVGLQTRQWLDRDFDPGYLFPDPISCRPDRYQVIPVHWSKGWTETGVGL